jgi:hypothetical protein
MNIRAFGLAALAVVGGAAVVLGSRPSSPAGPPAMAATSGPASSAAASPMASVLEPAPDADVIQVYKSPTCGCCGDWVEHLREHGFEVEVVDRPNMAAVKSELGLPGDMASCHTAIIAGYLVEGHVPAPDIQRMLAERPEVAGLAVPGMPVGSPGMEVEGRPADAYDVLAFDRQGTTSVWASY